MDWSFLDDNCEVRCINLVSRNDKFLHSQEEFKRIGLYDRVKYYRPIKYEGPISQKGCWDAHIYVMKDAVTKKRNLLIFEDDVFFDDTWKYSYKNIETAYKCMRWDILRIGAFVFKLSNIIQPDRAMRSGDLNATHALFLSYDFMCKCLEDPNFCPENNLANFGIDDYYRASAARDYIVHEPIAWQKDFPTDNKWVSGNNWLQNIFQHKYVYIFNQKAMYKISKFLAYFPYFIRSFNPYNILFFLHDYIYIRA